MDNAILDCSGLSKRYGDLLAVDDVSFHIESGETYGLLGPNGAGKTTTISMVVGVLEPDAGSVTIEGARISTDSVAGKQHVGYVPQDLALYPDLTATENLKFFGRLYGLGKGDLDERIGEVLEVIGLSDRAGDQVETFSGGMKRRLNIGVGLLHRPRLLILDEPTVGVDPQSRNAILESVEELGRAGMGVLYTTHYMEEAERLCDRVGIIDGGRIQAEGTRRELVALVGEHDRVAVKLTGNVPAATAAVQSLTEVIDVGLGDEGALQLIVQDARRVLPEILPVIADAGAGVASVDVTEPDLEAVFLHLTGRALRD